MRDAGNVPGFIAMDRKQLNLSVKKRFTPWISRDFTEVRKKTLDFADSSTPLDYDPLDALRCGIFAELILNINLTGEESSSGMTKNC